jgi:methionyl-tRNA formyltransferase
LSDRKRVLLFTAQDIGFRLIDALAARGDLELLVVTDRTDRDALNGYRCPIAACELHDVPFRRAQRVNDELLGLLVNFRPDLILSAYFPHIIPGAVRALAPAVNVHPGILPRYRGRFPTPWYILNGEAEFGVALHVLDEGVDTGPVYVQATYPMEPGITGAVFYRQAMGLAGDLVLGNLDALLAGELTPRPQEGVGSYYSAIERRWHIDWNLPRTIIERRVRVHAKPYFPAHAFVLSRMLLINRVSLIEVDGYTAQGVGKIIETRPGNEFVVSCSDGPLLVEDYDLVPAAEEEKGILIRPGRQLE